MFDELVNFYIDQPIPCTLAKIFKLYSFLFTPDEYSRLTCNIKLAGDDPDEIQHVMDEIEFYIEHATLETLANFTKDYYIQKYVFLQHLHVVEFVLEVERHPQCYDVIYNHFHIRYKDVEKLATQRRKNIEQDSPQISDPLDAYL